MESSEDHRPHQEKQGFEKVRTSEGARSESCCTGARCKLHRDPSSFRLRWALHHQYFNVFIGRSSPSHSHASARLLEFLKTTAARPPRREKQR